MMTMRIGAVFLCSPTESKQNYLLFYGTRVNNNIAGETHEIKDQADKIYLVCRKLRFCFSIFSAA